MISTSRWSSGRKRPSNELVSPQQTSTSWKEQTFIKFISFCNVKTETMFCFWRTFSSKPMELGEVPKLPQQLPWSSDWRYAAGESVQRLKRRVDPCRFGIKSNLFSRLNSLLSQHFFISSFTNPSFDKDQYEQSLIVLTKTLCSLNMSEQPLLAWPRQQRTSVPPKSVWLAGADRPAPAQDLEETKAHEGLNEGHVFHIFAFFLACVSLVLFLSCMAACDCVAVWPLGDRFLFSVDVFVALFPMVCQFVLLMYVGNVSGQL